MEVAASTGPTSAETFAGGLPPELGPVRPGEELAWHRLAAYLAAPLDVDGEMFVQQFPNGSANLTYLLTFQGRNGDADFVLRRPPFGAIAPGAHDMRREFRVLSRLWPVYDRAPRAYLFCEDHDIVGSDFVVSEYRRGVVIWSALPPSLAGSVDAASRVGFAVVDALADLHAVDPVCCGLEQLGRPDGYLERQVTGWRHRWQLVETPEHRTVMEEGAARLASAIPKSPRSTILHNDFKIDNCQFAPQDTRRVTAVFDWDMATLGDPLADLGTLLNYWPDPSDTAVDAAFHVPGLERVGLPPRSAVVERYAARTGTDVTNVGWYEAFACWRTGVILQQLYQRFIRGESRDPRMASRGTGVGVMATRALRILERAST